MKMNLCLLDIGTGAVWNMDARFILYDLKCMRYWIRIKNYRAGKYSARQKLILAQFLLSEQFSDPSRYDIDIEIYKLVISVCKGCVNLNITPRT